ncbi:MAG: hypothetical protein VW397_01300 [Candidatus Margulisiibacteriota bacterium]
MGEFKLLNQKNEFHTDVVSVMLDKAKINRYKTVHDYCKTQKLKLDESQLKLFTKKLEKLLYDQVFYYAHLMYHYMEVSGDWGEPGEQQVKITFCRNLLNVDPKVHLDMNHANEFNTKVKETIQKLKINTISVETAKKELRFYKFTIFGKQFELFRSNDLNRFLKFAVSDKFLHTGQYGSQMEIIYGRGKVKSYHGYNVTFVQKEFIRTPNNVMSMAAIIGHQNIYIRLESLSTIFAQKWIQIFDYNEFEMLTIHGDPYWNIAEGIKQKVLELYNIQTKAQLIENEKTFVNDMSETILYHELGHGIIQHQILPFELGAIGEATKIFGENIYTAILEFLADFSPTHNKLKGPIQNIIDISKRDRSRAKRMYLMYMSDTWFYNTDDEYMYTYSDLMTLILMRYLTKDDINFDLMEKELTYSPDLPKSKSHFDRIISLYKSDIQELKTICENATFLINSQDLKYKNIRAFLIEEFKKNDGFVHVDTYEFLVPYWTNVLGYVQSISNSKQIVKDYFSQQQEKIMKKIMVLSCGKEKAQSYQFDHRLYIKDRMVELEILAINA